MEEVLTNEDTVRAGWLLLVAQVKYNLFHHILKTMKQQIPDF